MCGIAGIALAPEAQVSPDQIRMMMGILGLSMDARGGHSWGLYIDSHPEIYRALGQFWQGSDLMGYDLTQTRVFALHTRFATTGEKTVPNAHPFVQNNIIGAHNGVITNHAALNVKYKREFAVDSQHIFEHIAQGHPLDDLYGSAAVWWLDKDEDIEDSSIPRIYLARSNSDNLYIRGLSYATKDNPENEFGVVWASTPQAVNIACQMAGLPSFQFTIKEHQLYYVGGGRLYYNSEEKFQLAQSVIEYGYARGKDDAPYKVYNTRINKQTDYAFCNERQGLEPYHLYAKCIRCRYRGDVITKSAPKTIWCRDCYVKDVEGNRTYTPYGTLRDTLAKSPPAASQASGISRRERRRLKKETRQQSLSIIATGLDLIEFGTCECCHEREVSFWYDDGGDEGVAICPGCKIELGVTDPMTKLITAQNCCQVCIRRPTTMTMRIDGEGQQLVCPNCVDVIVRHNSNQRDIRAQKLLAAAAGSTVKEVSETVH